MSETPQSTSYDESSRHHPELHPGDANLESSSDVYEQSSENEALHPYAAQYPINGTSEGEFEHDGESADHYEVQDYYETAEGYTPEQGYEAGQSYEEEAYTPPIEAFVAPAPAEMPVIASPVEATMPAPAPLSVVVVSPVSPVITPAPVETPAFIPSVEAVTPAPAETLSVEAVTPAPVEVPPPAEAVALAPVRVPPAKTVAPAPVEVSPVAVAVPASVEESIPVARAKDSEPELSEIPVVALPEATTAASAPVEVSAAPVVLVKNVVPPTPPPVPRARDSMPSPTAISAIAPSIPTPTTEAVKPAPNPTTQPPVAQPPQTAAVAPLPLEAAVAPNIFKHIAPRQVVIRNPQKRLEEEEQKRATGALSHKLSADTGASDSDSKILALTHQLQELIAHKKEDGAASLTSSATAADAPDAAGNKGRRGAAFKQSGTQVGMRPPPLAPLIPLAPTAASATVRDGTPPSSISPTPLTPRPPMPAFSGPDYTPQTPWLKRIVLILLAFVLLAGMFAAGRLTAPESIDPKLARRDGRPAAPSANAWSDAAIAQLDQVLAADQNGEMDAVFRMAYNLKNTAKQSAGLDIYLANIESRRQNYNEAEALLSQSSADRDPATLNDQFGYSFTRRRDFEKATLWLTRAAADNPFSADIFYRLAESLRRQGNLQQAVDKFHQCLLRMPMEAQFDDLREWTALKMRLAQLELGKTSDIRNEVEAHLNQPDPSGYWWLTSAAMYLQGGDMASASEMLSKAQSDLGSKRFDSLMSDYFFRGYADRQQIASFFAKETNVKQRKQDSRTAYFIDP